MCLIVQRLDLKLSSPPFPQTGLYRLSGSDRQVKELKEKFLRCKTVPVLSKVDDIHVITGVLKDFLRNLKEPLLTFGLNHPFMDAAGESLYALMPSVRSASGVLIGFAPCFFTFRDIWWGQQQSSHVPNHRRPAAAQQRHAGLPDHSPPEVNTY